MDHLPDEIVLHIASFLDKYAVTRLSIVSKHFNRIVSDNELWRFLCFQDSLPQSRRFRANPRPVAESTIYNLQETVAKSGVGRANVGEGAGRDARASTLWNRTLAHEHMDWRSDYIGRHAALEVDWIHTPDTYQNVSHEDAEAKGLAAIDERRVIAPLGDGSIRIWDTSTEDQYGAILHHTRRNLLFDTPGQRVLTDHLPLQSHPDTISEGLSIDKSRNRAYFVVGKGLVEVDLATLQVNAHDRFPEAITALSPALQDTSLTVGTAKALYIYDPRAKVRCGAQVAAIQEHMKKASDFYRLISGDPSYAPLAEPLPLSIVHSSEHNIHAAGRFPSILNYDRRNYPQVASTIHSGARLSCLSLVPSAAGSVRLAAVGDYNGKGSIELYSLSRLGPVEGESVRNRISVSRSKCLSISSHGSRLLYSDGDGMVKWVERDAWTPVRRWNINHFKENTADESTVQASRGGIFRAEVGNGDVARRLVPMSDSPDSDVCVWTGEKVGVMHFGKNRQIDSGSTSKEDSPSEPVSDEEKSYGRMMRRALERQADEVRFMTDLGLGRSL